MDIRIAEIPYLNCAPFYWNKDMLGNLRIQWISNSPKELGRLAKQGKIDAGPISLVDSFQLEDRFEPLGNFGIAVKNSAKSVLLFSKKPIPSLGGGVIGLTPQSVTSIKLLQLILELKYGIQARYHEGFHRSDDAQLRIGDEALQMAARNGKSLVVDLGEEWIQWQNLPFVFARWVVRRSIETESKKTLSLWLQRNLESSGKKYEKAIGWYRKEKKSKAPKAEEYLKDFNYVLGKKEKKAIAVFGQLLPRLQKI
ncbi:MAG: menaquinone biosynthesis protein [Elusimicrobia bacterium]|nr:menaquinone biosynthesis protein [Elusimicrobiota bacterium]